ncbi:hypothetical protein IBX73_02435 [candidate division WOR-3 bacterium]|nr:hypothetical protein [candidate division WOR-3 bacterium]
MNIVVLACLITMPIDMGGYVETRPYVTWGDSTDFLGYNRGWLEFKTDMVKYGAQIAFDLIVPYDTGSPGYALDNIEISRLTVWLGDEKARVVAGKQSLYWGVGRVFRPLDVFNRTNYFEPGYERAGSNALLGYLSLGDLTSVRGVVMPRGDVEKTLAGMRTGANLAGNDIGFTVMHQSSERRTIVGGEVTGELAVGYWGEIANTWHDTVDYSRMSAGLDYTFPLAIYTMIEYFFDGSGESDPAYYNYTLIASGERQTLAQHYLYTSIGLLYNPFLRPSLSAITNLNDRGTIVIPQLSYGIFENAEITLGLNYALGSTESEFRNIMPYRGAVYVWARVYF